GEVVVRGGDVAEPRLELADNELGEVRPVRRGRRLLLDVIEQRVVLAEGAGRVQVARLDVVQRSDVGRSLDGGVAAQRQDAAARPADVAQQQLQDRRGPDHLYAGRVLRPADRVANGAGAVGAGVVPQRLRDLQENFLGRAAHLLNQL